MLIGTQILICCVIAYFKIILRSSRLGLYLENHPFNLYNSGGTDVLENCVSSSVGLVTQRM